MEARTRSGKWLLQITFAGVFILMGIDKYLNYFEPDWPHHVAPVFMQVLHGNATLFFQIIGALEIIVGIGVLIKPNIFAFIMSGWLLLIVIDLALGTEGYDDAIRDAGLGLSALSLGILSLKRRKS